MTDLEECILRHDDDDKGTNNLNCIPTGLLQTAPACGLTLDHVEYNTTI
jgi:hypothetical protein